MKGKTQKGITLIALIITIIVLMILAVVAINTVDNTGIIKYAQNASKEYEKGIDEENTMLQNYIDILDKYSSIGDKTDSTEEITLSQIKQGDVWQNVTFASNISNNGITFPSTINYYENENINGIPKVEPYDFEGHTSFNVYQTKDGDGDLLTGWSFLYSEKESYFNNASIFHIINHNSESPKAYVIFLRTDDDYEIGKIYEMTESGLNLVNEEINISGTVEYDWVPGQGNYYGQYPILDGFEKWFTGTVDYVQ